MRTAQRVAGLCLIAAAFSYSAPTIADDHTLLDDIYFNAGLVSGRSDGSSDLEGAGVSLGLSLPENLFVQGDYHYLDLTEGLNNTHLFKAIGGVQNIVNQSVSVYFGAGGYYAEEDGDDADNGDGAVLSTGITWGTPKLSALLHVDYLNSMGDDASEAYLVGIGIRMQLGGGRQMQREKQKTSSAMDRTTACEERYRDLHPLCNETAAE